MGLDITAYSHLTPVGHVVHPYCGEEDHIEAYAYSVFPRSFKGIPVIETSAGFLHGGCFLPTEKTEVHSFRAGSCTGYGHWRADLQERFNPGRYREAPFYELINFADNEGVIGPLAAADLAQDFRQNAKRYKDFGTGQDYIWMYDNFARVTELAAQCGFIKFH